MIHSLARRVLSSLLLALLDRLDTAPRRRRRPATTSTARPAGQQHAPRMRTSTAILIAFIASAGCNEGCNRPDPPDPVPADCKPGQACPVDGETPPPIGQPPTTPEPAKKVEPVQTPPPT